MRNSSSLDWLRFMHTPNDYRVSHNFMNVLVNDAQREFFGEGQTFFMFKRLMRTMKGREEVQATEENMVLPLPTSESEF